MLTNKKQTISGALLVALLLVVVHPGCRPSGPDALLDGKRLLDHGQPGVAIRKFRVATSQMPTNGLAWGYLGLAYHRTGASAKAMEAYSRALLLNPDLAEVRFNLGCLWMDQNEWGQAREQFTAATVLQKNAALTWQRLGETQVRLGEYQSAVPSLGESLRIDPKSPDAWNWLGVAQSRQRRTQEAAGSFQTALKLQANHGPALLNLAILNQTQLNNPARALELYRQYLAFLPDAANASEVRRVSAQLEVGLNSAAKASMVAVKNEKTSAKQESPQPTTSRPVSRTGQITLSEPDRQLVTNSSSTTLTSPDPVKQPPLETKRITPTPAIVSTPLAPAKTVPQTNGGRTATTIADPPIDVPAQQPQTPGASSPKKRGFFAKVNPLNLFKKKSDEKQPTPLPPRIITTSEEAVQTPSDAAGRYQSNGSAMVTRLDEIDGADQFKRYPYRWSAPPTAGDRQAATKDFDEGEKLRKRGRYSEALKSYQSAVQEDPSHFAAQFNLGLLHLQGGEMIPALSEFEAATAIRPASVEARYNFALTLKKAGYPVDAGNELLTLLRQTPDETRAHLTLGNLYAQQFRDQGRARVEYRRVLELEPGHPQASLIHRWLVQNPL